MADVLPLFLISSPISVSAVAIALHVNIWVSQRQWWLWQSGILSLLLCIPFSLLLFLLLFSNDSMITKSWWKS